MTKEQSNVIKVYNDKKKIFAKALENSALNIIEACFNRHNEDEVTIMFDETIIVVSSNPPYRNPKPYNALCGLLMVSGVRMTKYKMREDDVRYSIALLDAENEVAMYFDFADISTKMQVIDELIKTAKKG